MEPPTHRETRLIQQLRDSVSDLDLDGHYNTDTFYLRWIRARDGDLVKAEEMLRKNAAWREANEIDTISKWEPYHESVPELYPMEITGFDKTGCPVCIIPFAYWDVRQGVEKGYRKEIIKHIDQGFEVVEAMMRQRSTSEKPVTQLNLLFDVQNLSFWQLASKQTVEAILEVVSRFEANHPEVLRRAYVINASRIFNILYNLVRPFLSTRTFSKVSIHSTNETEWKSVLLGDIAKGQLPHYFGGTAWTSLNMYKVITSKITSSKNEWKMMSINQKEKKLLYFDINKPNSRLLWRFKSEYYDIEFTIYKEGNENEPKVAYDRHSSQFFQVYGEVICTDVGRYVAEFNNEYSKISPSKTVHYNFRVVGPRK